MLQTARSRFRKPSQILSSVFFRFRLHCHIHVSQVKLVVTNNSLLGSWKVKVRRVNRTFEKWSQD